MDTTHYTKRINELLLTQKLMARKIGRLPLKGKILIGLSLMLSMLLYGSIMYALVKNDLKDEGMLETDKCPACYGQSACEDLRNGEYKFQGYSKLRFLDTVNVKNVHYGARGGRDLVLKKLAHNKELAEFDAKMCGYDGKSGGCDVKEAVMNAIVSKKSGYGWIINTVREASDMTRCPTQRLIDRILHLFEEKADAVDLTGQEKMYMVTSLMINPEPLMLQTFPHTNGWPFPEYVGACGRFVIVENAGETLDNFLNDPWHQRANYALQILKIAQLFTENELQFGLYWTDLDYHNLAVNKHGRIVVIDAENIIVVDKWQIKQDAKTDWDIPYYSHFADCPVMSTDCLNIQPDMLCTRYTADHNFYAACRNLLSPYAPESGLLHDIPADIEKKYGLSRLLELCTNPQKDGQRFEVKEDIRRALSSIVLDSEA